MDLKDLLKKLPFNKSDPVGLDIGYSSVKVVKLTRPKQKGQNYEIAFCGQLPLIASEPDFVPKLQEYLGKNSLLGLAAATCFDDSKLKIRKIEIAKMPEADLLEAIRWKMRDLVEGDVNDFVVQYSILAETGPADTKRYILIGFLAPRSAVKTSMEVIRKLGLTPKIVEPSAISLAACVEKIHPSENKWVGAIDLGASKSIMVVIGNGKFHFSRPLTGILVKNIEQVEPTFNQRLAAEIQHTLDNFSIAFHIERLDKVLLSGGGAGVPGLTDYLTKNLAIETETLNPFLAISPSPPPVEHPYLFSQAVSLAMTEQK